MKNLKRFLTICLVVLALSLWGCGGGGGGNSSNSNDGGGGPVNVDSDNDGIPDTDDALPNDPDRFASFHVTPLDRLEGGSSSAAVSINEGGESVGYSDNADGVTRGVRWAAGDSVPTALAPLPGNPGHHSAAFFVNDLGEAVGESESDLATVAVYWRAGQVAAEALPGFASLVDADSAALAINNAGQIVGEGIIDESGNTGALYWSDRGTAPIQLPGLGGHFSSAGFIGESGLIVGEAELPNGRVHAVLWTDAGNGTDFRAFELPPLAGHVASKAFSLDGNGRIAGESEAEDGTRHGVLWRIADQAVETVDLGIFVSAKAINDFNRVAGNSVPASGNDQALVLDTRNPNHPQALDIAFSQALDINNSDHVVGFSGGKAFLAVPE